MAWSAITVFRPSPTRSGFVVLLDGSLSGGSAANPALQTNSNMYLHDVSSSGYEATLLDVSGATPVLTKGSISELVVGGAKSTLTGPATAGSLKLPIEETPSLHQLLAGGLAAVPAAAGSETAPRFRPR